jgi:hypothetical protein
MYSLLSVVDDGFDVRNDSYTVTDVKDLADWHDKHCSAHLMFEKARLARNAPPPPPVPCVVCREYQWLVVALEKSALAPCAWHKVCTRRPHLQ